MVLGQQFALCLGNWVLFLLLFWLRDYQLFLQKKVFIMSATCCGFDIILFHISFEFSYNILKVFLLSLLLAT
jgi:hypothetical protein